MIAGRADNPDAHTLHEVDANAAGVTVTPLPVLDPTRPLARVTFDEVSSITIASPRTSPNASGPWHGRCCRPSRSAVRRARWS